METAVQTAAEKQQNSGTTAEPKQNEKLLTCLLTLAHFGARALYKNGAVRITVHQARPAAKAVGVESAIQGDCYKESSGSCSDLLGFGEEALTHFCARACD